MRQTLFRDGDGHINVASLWPKLDWLVRHFKEWKASRDWKLVNGSFHGTHTNCDP